MPSFFQKAEGVFLTALTDKQKRFCEEYLIDLNVTQSAIRAGYSEKTAYSIGNENLKKPEIQNHISKLMEIQSRRTGITADKIIDELGKVAFADTEISGKEKIKALELLGKHLGMFDNKQSDTGNEAEIPKLMEALKDDIS